MKISIKFAVLATAVGILSLSTTTTTQAKAGKSTKVTHTLIYSPSDKVKATHGYMYANTKLAKRTHHLTNYQHTIFYTNKMVWLRKPNHKTYIFQYLKSKNGHVRGYVWNKYVKPYKTTNTVNSGSDKNTTDDNGSNVAVANSAGLTPQTDFSLSDYRAAFLQDLNNERAKRGLAPVTEDPQYDQIAQQRSAQLVTSFSHYDSEGNTIAKQLSTQAGITTWKSENIANESWGHMSGSELIDGSSSSKEVASDDIHMYIYDDAAHNWGHRDALLNPTYNTIGMGATQDTNNFRVFTDNELGTK